MIYSAPFEVKPIHSPGLRHWVRGLPRSVARGVVVILSEVAASTFLGLRFSGRAATQSKNPS
jgi:hypothetical protein